MFSTVTTVSQRKKRDQLGLALEDWFLALETLQVQLQNNDPIAKRLREQIMELSQYLEEINSSLYELHSPHLKEIKKDHKRMLKVLQSELELYLSGENHAQLVERSLNQLTKLKSGPYNEISPLERNTFYLEWVFKNKSIFDFQSFERDFVEVALG